MGLARLRPQLSRERRTAGRLTLRVSFKMTACGRVRQANCTELVILLAPAQKMIICGARTY